MLQQVGQVTQLGDKAKYAGAEKICMIKIIAMGHNSVKYLPRKKVTSPFIIIDCYYPMN
ncbi:hypothetical protein [Parasediminibacterium sp. JCM 36343]|uniref:hypothetical protein n=1 Tax=Parasediminibacterium sp. JCM 36343 TaxID=3374279 RepID=UPI00397A9CDE